MNYNNVKTCLPELLIKEIQKYVDGEYIYVPKKTCERRSWGSNNGTREELTLRNRNIYNDYLKGDSTKELATIYFLSIKSIQRIILEAKRNKTPYD